MRKRGKRTKGDLWGNMKPSKGKIIRWVIKYMEIYNYNTGKQRADSISIFYALKGKQCPEETEGKYLQVYNHHWKEFKDWLQFRK